MAKVEIVKRHKSVRTRPKAVFLRVTEDELRELEEASELALLPLTTWARQVLMRAAVDAKVRSKRLRGNVSTDAQCIGAPLPYSRPQLTELADDDPRVAAVVADKAVGT